MKFTYQAIAKNGSKISGVCSADSKEQALAVVSKNGGFVTEIKAVNDEKLLSVSSGKVSSDDLEFLTSELSILLNNGIKIDKALSMLAKVKQGSAIGEMISGISEHLGKGGSLSEAFEQYPQYFSSLYINLINIGEKTATLKGVFSELAKDLKFKGQIKKRLTQALIYPSVIFFVCISSILFIFNYVVPSMASIFEGRDNIPFYTQFILDASDWLIAYQFNLLVAVVILIYVVIKLWQQPQFKSKMQKLLMKMPVVGPVYLEVERVNYTSAVKLMLKSGLKINQALEYAIGNIANEEIKQELEFAVNELKGGGSLNQVLSGSKLFPTYYQSLIEVGEETAELESVFSEIVERSKNAFEAKVTQMLNMLEPLLIVVMGLVVGGVVVTLMLSITSVNEVGG
ncbi:type II secretion system F family protein [Litorilituus lipolyticus]|uniref:Type II secretion system F family protein n=1 Tax=Litorilituus lipolyticus TaxID=2491017 RepID=A0A502L9A0_9GAMM|nr:type II secretion system F family protein [Litorilituus lipolyticus]TPH18975.1 type II secretion system F family protein [Litorilituus lipolyticus]